VDVTNAEIVVPSGMSVPVALRPTSVAVKFAVAEVSVVPARVPSVTERVGALSIKNDVPAGIAAVVGTFNVTKHAPEIDLTKLRAPRPAVADEIVRFTNPVADAQLLAVNDVAATPMAAAFVIVRAAPLWYTTLLKSWIVYVGEEASPVPTVARWKMHATRRKLFDPGHAG